MRWVFLLLPFLCHLGTCQNLSALCGSPAAQATCGQCIKQHPDCAWCRDPHTTLQNRCQPRSAFKTETCNPTYVYSPTTEVRIGPQNLPLGSPLAGKTTVQIEPQQVVLRMKPGDTLDVQYKYVHKKPAPGYDVREFMVQTSEFKKFGVDMKFYVNCDGREVEGNRCPMLKEGQKVNFKIKVSLLECRHGADVAISVGVYGYTTVSALYITPLCGCECEKPAQQEKNSPLCHQHGNLICGQCECEATRGGDRCECPLASYGVKNAIELEDRCREKPGSPICSGQGMCRCGQCQCNAQTITGRFCQCDHASCPIDANGRQCSGNGVCECGKCRCEDGWERDDCSCSTDDSTCMENGVECSNHGHCECGRCVCDEGFNGARCGAADEIVTMSPPEEEEMPEEEPKDPIGAAEPTTVEEDVQNMAEDPVSHEDNNAVESTVSDYPQDAETAEESMTSSAVFISLTTIAFTFAFI